MGKTEYYDNSLAAIAALRDGKRASLGYWVDPETNRTGAELRAEFERDIVDESTVARSRSRFRRIFRMSDFSMS